MTWKRRPIDLAAPALAGSMLVASCALPPVRLETPEPMKIDVSVKVEISPIKKESGDAEGPVGTTRRTRMEEIQNLKNNRIVGEDQKGYLALRDVPPAWKEHEAYIKEVIAAENNDRQLMYSTRVRDEKKTLGEVEALFAEQWRDKSFRGEWVQTPDGQWQQKK